MRRALTSIWRRFTQILIKRQQFILYGLIGVSGATLDFVVYLLLYKYVGIFPPVASLISVTVGITNNFILNARFNFKVGDKLLRRFYSFYATGLAGALLSAALIFVFQKLHIGPTEAKLLTIPPIVLGQYVINKRVSFK